MHNRKLDPVPKGFLENGLKEDRVKQNDWISVNPFPLAEENLNHLPSFSGGSVASSLYEK